uniref:Tetraspanin n=1 Tax=Parastrongyloides trichosuri TaxID=131310 RepID=A0A0N5A678_PARTI
MKNLKEIESKSTINKRQKKQINISSVPTYKVWLYSTNILLIILQSIYLLFLYHFFSKKYIQYFPISFNDRILIGNYTIISIQYLSSISAIIGVLIYSRHLLRLFWFIITSLLFFDILLAIIITFQFSTLHANYETYFNSYIGDNLNSLNKTCQDWIEFERDNLCCINSTVLENCFSPNYDNCFNQNIEPCHYTLLKWIHNEVDFLIIIYYFMIYPLKFIIVIALRDDVTELFYEIIFTKNRHLYTHWAFNEEGDDVSFVTISNSSYGKNSNSSNTEGNTLICEDRNV